METQSNKFFKFPNHICLFLAFLNAIHSEASQMHFSFPATFSCSIVTQKLTEQ